MWSFHIWLGWHLCFPHGFDDATGAHHWMAADPRCDCSLRAVAVWECHHQVQPLGDLRGSGVGSYLVMTRFFLVELPQNDPKWLLNQEDDQHDQPDLPMPLELGEGVQPGDLGWNPTAPMSSKRRFQGKERNLPQLKFLDLAFRFEKRQLKIREKLVVSTQLAKSTWEAQMVRSYLYRQLQAWGAATSMIFEAQRSLQHVHIGGDFNESMHCFRDMTCFKFSPWALEDGIIGQECGIRIWLVPRLIRIGKQFKIITACVVTVSDWT